MSHNFKIGDKVRRTKGEHLGMKPGDVGTVEAMYGEESIVLTEYKSGDFGGGSHSATKFELERTALGQMLRDAVASAADSCKDRVDASVLQAATKDTNPKEAIGDKKVPLWLCSPIAKAHWAAAQFAGQVKYGSWNWRVAGVRSSTYLSAMQRHLDAYMSGEELDPVDQTKHLGNIMACAAILLDAQAAGKLNDDRPPSVGIREAYKEVERVMQVARDQHGHLKPRNYTIEDTQ